MRSVIFFPAAIGLSIAAHAAGLALLEDAPVLLTPKHPLEATVTASRHPKHRPACTKEPAAQGKPASEHCRAAP